MNSQNERMNALRNINKQLEVKSEDIKQKCSELTCLKDYCLELETKYKNQAKRIELLEVAQKKPENSLENK